MMYVFLSVEDCFCQCTAILPSRFCFLNLPCPLPGRVSLFLLCAHVASYSLVFPHFAESSIGLHISQAGPLVSFPGVSQHLKLRFSVCKIDRALSIAGGHLRALDPVQGFNFLWSSCLSLYYGTAYPGLCLGQAQKEVHLP